MIIDIYSYIVFQTPLVDANSTAPAPAKPPVIVHTSLLTAKHGLRYHKLTSVHDPELSGLLSAESAESSEVVAVAPAVTAAVEPALVAAAEPALIAAAQPALIAAAEPALTATDSAEAPAVMVKRQAPALDAAAQAAPISLVPLCPGKKKYY